MARKKRLLSTEQVCRQLAIQKASLARYVRAGIFPKGMGKPPKWMQEDVDAWVHLRSRGVRVLVPAASADPDPDPATGT